MWKTIKSLCETSESGEMRLRNYPGKLMGDLLAWGMGDDLCLCCIAVRVWILITLGFAVGFGTAQLL